jgi:putative transposase
MDANYCVDALKGGIAKHGTPEIFNNDQGSQFTSGAWTDALLDEQIKSALRGKVPGATTA